MEACVQLHAPNALSRRKASRLPIQQERQTRTGWVGLPQPEIQLRFFDCPGRSQQAPAQLRVKRVKSEPMKLESSVSALYRLLLSPHVPEFSPITRRLRERILIVIINKRVLLMERVKNSSCNNLPSVKSLTKSCYRLPSDTCSFKKLSR